MSEQENDWVAEARSILHEYFTNGELEELCQFWLDFPEFPYDSSEVAYIFSAAQMSQNSEVVVNIWDRLNQPLDMKCSVLLSIISHLMELDREEDARRAWEALANRYEENGCDYDANFTDSQEAFGFFRLGLVLAFGMGKDAIDRWEKILHSLEATRKKLDRLRYDLLQSVLGDFEDMSLYSPEYREKECPAQSEFLMRFVKSCEDLHVRSFDDAPYAVPDAEAAFLREKWLSGDIEGAVDRAVEIVAKARIPKSEPSAFIEYLNVVWEPPVMRNAPAVPKALAQTATEREVLAALFASWDGQTYRNFFEIFRNVDWETIPPYCCAMVGIACAVAVEEEGLKNAETVRLARLFIKSLTLTKKRGKVFEVYGRLSDWFLSTYIDPADVEEVLRERSEGLRLLIDLYDGDLVNADFTDHCEILQSVWSTNFYLYSDYEPFRFEEAASLLFSAPFDVCADESSIHYRIALIDKLIRSKDISDKDLREICEEAVEAIDESDLSDEDKEFFYRWFTRRAPSCDPDDFTLDADDNALVDEHLEVDCDAVGRIAEWNDCEVLDWLTVRRGVKAALLRRRNDTGERWVIVAHGFVTTNPQYGSRYLLPIGEKVDSFAALTAKKALLSLIKKLVLPEIRAGFPAPPAATNWVFSMRHFSDEGFEKWIQGYDYVGYVCAIPRGIAHPAILFQPEAEGHLPEDQFMNLVEEDQGKICGRALLEVIPLLPDEVALFERGIRMEDFYAIHPDKNFAFFAAENPKTVAAPAARMPSKRAPSLRAVRKPSKRS